MTNTKILITALEIIDLCTLAPVSINEHVPIVSGCCNRHQGEITGNQDIRTEQISVL
jgi:hypothetical protein